MPNPSRATAVKVCGPLLALVVFHEIEYGALVSSAPRLAPSSLNWTPSTVRRPMMLTLALTGTVPWTVEPDCGDVTVTTRPPSCAEAGGEIHARPKVNREAAAQARLAILIMDSPLSRAPSEPARL